MIISPQPSRITALVAPESRLLRRLSGRLRELSRGTLAFTSLEVAEAARRAAPAAAALGHVLEYRKQAEWGPWESRYRGDWRIRAQRSHSA
jgi:hypothetical protein